MRPRGRLQKQTTWPVGQAVKTAASHAANMGSIPVRVTKQFHSDFSCCKAIKIVGVDCDEGPPVPIPNTEVKLIRAEDTCLETDR